jgi:hypothetical protein
MEFQYHKMYISVTKIHGVKMKRLIISTTVILILLFLIWKFGNTATGKSEDCIEPLESFAYSVNVESDPSVKKTKILPGHPWIIETKIPTDEYQDGNNTPLNLVNIFNTDLFKEIWILRTTYDKETLTFKKEYLIYNTQDKSWKNIPAELFPGKIDVGSILITKKGDIFGINEFINGVDWKETQDIGDYYLISVFNRESGKFVVDKNSKNPLYFQSNSKRQILFDPKGILWIIDENGTITNYDLYNGKFNQVIKLDNVIIDNETIAPDGSIYFMDAHISYGTEIAVIYHYQPANKTIEEIELVNIEPVLDSFFSGIKVDDKGRIWFGDIGWRDENGIWHRYLTPPLFLTDRMYEGRYKYYFNQEGSNGSIVAYTSDESVWFSSMNGLTRSNANEEKWCWVTTESSNIIEDSNGYAWILVDNKLYKRLLGE